MIKLFLNLAILSVAFSSPILAEAKVDLPLTPKMDQNMRTMAAAYEKRIASEMQLRATDLYTMGQALMGHEGHPECQAHGKKLIENAKHLYQLSKAILEGNEVSPEDMKNFVKQWS